MALTTQVGLEFVARNRANRQINSFNQSIQRMGRRMMAIAGVGGGLYMLNRGLRGALNAFMEQEKAERALSVAVEGNIKQFKAYAAQMQSLTVYGDEQILSQMAYAKNLGVAREQLEEATTAAIGLAAKYRLDLATSMMLVGRASQGQTQMLTRYGIVLKESLSAQEKFNAVLKIGAEAFHLAEAETETLAGSWQQFKNNVGDFAEEIVGAYLDVAKGLKDVAQHYSGVETNAKKAHDQMKILKKNLPNFKANMWGAFYYPPPKYATPIPKDLARPPILVQAVTEFQKRVKQEEELIKRLDATNMATEASVQQIRDKYLPLIQKEIDITGRVGEAHYHAAKMVEYENAIKKEGLWDTAYGIRLMEEMEHKLKELEKAQRLARIADDIGASFANAFEDMIFEAKKFEEVMRSVIRSIARSVMQNLIFQPMGRAISGAISGGLSGLFGGSTPAGYGKVGGKLVPLEGYQHGGWATGPTMALLGEKEPELVTPLSKLPRGGSGGGIIINFTNTGTPQQIVNAEMLDAQDQRILDLVTEDVRQGGQVRHTIREVIRND